MEFLNQGDGLDTGTVHRELAAENNKLLEARDLVYDMMSDFGANDVREGNIDIVHRELEKISNARGDFRVRVRQYRRKFSTVHPANCTEVEKQLQTINDQVREHANVVWSKVEEVKHRQSVNVQLINR